MDTNETDPYPTPRLHDTHADASQPSGSRPRLEVIVADSAALLAAFLADSTTTCCLVVSGGGIVQYANRALDALLGQSPGGTLGQSIGDFLSAPAAALAAVRHAAECETDSSPVVLKGVGSHGARFALRCRVASHDDGLVMFGEAVHDVGGDMPLLLFDLNNQLAVTMRETARQKREFEQDHWQLTKLGEILPMCVECTRVQTADAVWEDVSVFFQRHSKFLSHGYCPACAERLSSDWGLD